MIKRRAIFAAAHKLIEAVGPSLLDKLERGDVHLSICLMQTIQNDDHPFDSYPLPPMEFFAAGHTSLALGTAGSIDITKLAPYPLLLLDPSSVIRGTFNAACRLAGLKPNIFVEIGRRKPCWRLQKPGTAWRSCPPCCQHIVIASASPAS